MSQDLVFMMGKYEARFPVDRVYSTNHLWLKRVDGGWHVGLTAYSVRLLQDVYFLEWMIDAGTQVVRKQEIGEIESSKALSSLFAPCDGTVVEFNEALLDDPTPINTDSYESGWLYRMETSSDLLEPDAYLAVLEENWPEAQRMIKGQMN